MNKYKTISEVMKNINKEKYKNYSFYQNNILNSEKIPECDLFIFRHTMMHLSMNDNIHFINKLKKKSNCFVFLTHHEIKENNQGEPHESNMTSLKWVNKNLHIKPFEIKEYLVDNGITSSRLMTVGYGEDKPMVSNNTRKGRIKNRRVEFKVIPPPAK